MPPKTGRKGDAQAAALPPATRAGVSLDLRAHLLLGGVFLLALLLRGLFLWGQVEHNPIVDHPQMDPAVHHDWAQRIASGQGMPPEPYIRAPLYYYLLGLVYMVTGPSVLAARILGCVIGAAACYLIARLGLALGGLRVGLLAGALAALYWPLIVFDTRLLTVGLEVLLNTGLLLALLSAGRRQSLGMWIVAGLLWGLSAITRPNVLALVPVVLLWSWIAVPHVRGLWPRLRGGVIACACLALVILPVTLRNLVVGGELVLITTSGGVNFFIGNNPNSDGYTVRVPGTRPTWDAWLEDIEAIPEGELGRALSAREVSSYWFGRAWQWIQRDQLDWLGLLVHKFRLFWSPLEIPNNGPLWFLARLSPIAAVFWIGFPLIAVLAVAALTHLRSRAWLLPLMFALVYMATVVLFFCPARFRLPIVPVLLVAAAAAIWHVVDLVRARRWRGLAPFAVVALLAGAFVLTNPPPRTEFFRRAEAEGHAALGRFYATPAPDGPNDFQQAVTHLRQAVELAPHEVHHHLTLARTLETFDEFDAAGQRYTETVSRFPQDAAARLFYGQYLANRGDLPAAAEQLRAALQLRPWFADAHMHLGAVLLQARQYEPAAEHFRAVLRVRPNPLARYNLGMCLLRLGRDAEALAVFETALEADADQPRVWQNKGVLHARAGDLDAAIDAFERALQLDPALTEASINLARALQQSGRWLAARDVLDAALEQTPAHVNLLSAAALALATAPEDDARNGARAVELAERAGRLVMEQPPVPLLQALAAAYAEVGRYDEAVQTCRAAVNIARSTGSEYWLARLRPQLAQYAQQRPWRAPTSR